MSMNVEHATASGDQVESETDAVDQIVAAARRAQRDFSTQPDQSRYDQAALAAAWAVMQPEHNNELSHLAVESTGLGRVQDKIAKNHRKTLGLLRDLSRAQTAGVISRDMQRGITEVARPIGLVGAVVPSTNPVATPANNVINALKCGNAIVLSPSPSGTPVCERLLELMHQEFDKLSIDQNLVQMLPRPSSKNKTQRLMEQADLVIVTGSQDNVRRAYSSGTPAIGVGAGNATVIVDETADLQEAARKISASKCFDNATSCSSENAIVVVQQVAEQLLRCLHEQGGRWLGDQQTRQLKDALFQSGHLNRHMIARDLDVFLNVAGVEVSEPETARFVMLGADEVGRQAPESGEKLSLALSVFVVDDFDAAVVKAEELLNHQGAGHSVGLHSRNEDRAVQLAHVLPTCRVIVNQAHCFATGGSFDNGLPFSLSMGCGSWGGNSIDSNLHYRHFMNITRVVQPIATDEPSVEEIFGDYWALAGK